MRRSFYIIGGIIITILLVVWLFLLFSSDQTKKDVFNSFGLENTTNDDFFASDIIDAIIPDIFEEKSRLRQLTTRRVIGYTEVTTASSSAIYYTEAGTGHVYKLDTVSNSETRVSNITVPNARSASIAKDGSIAIVQAGENSLETTVVTLAGESIDSFLLDERVENFTMSSNNELLYTTAAAQSVFGRQYDIKNRVSKTLFEVPFREVAVSWGKEGTAAHVIYPKPSRLLQGYAYEAKNGLLQRLPASGFGLVPLYNDVFLLYMKQSDKELTTHLFNKVTGVTTGLPLSLFPPKCAFNSLNTRLYCADANQTSDVDFPDNWLRGEKTYTDSLWVLNVETNEASLLSITLEESGRELDIIEPKAAEDERGLYFINKNDQTLWVYDLEDIMTETQS